MADEDKQSLKAQAKAVGITTGAFALFNGYSSAVEGEEEILEKDMPVKIIRFDEGEGDIVVVGVDEDGNELLDKDSGEPSHAERVFLSEIEAAELETGDAEGGDDIEEAEDNSSEAEAGDSEAGDSEAVRDSESASEDLPALNERMTVKEIAAIAKDEGADISNAVTKKDRIEAIEAARSAPVEEEKPKAEAKNKKTEVKKSEPEQIAPMASVTKALSDADNATDAARHLIEQVERTYFTLGGVLDHVDQTGIHKQMGYDGKNAFKDYIDGELDLEYRKARYLISVYRACSLANIGETELADIGWSKAKEIARIAIDDLKRDKDALLEMAKTTTRDELTEHIKKNYEVATRGGDTVKMTKFSFSVAEEDAIGVNEGITEAMAAIGEEDMGKAFAYIVNDWRGHSDGSDMTLEQTVELAEARFGVKITTTPVGETEEASEEEAEEKAA